MREVLDLLREAADASTTHSCDGYCMECEYVYGRCPEFDDEDEDEGGMMIEVSRPKEEKT